jgi:V8-like Glu-specific endopeptidase
MSEPGTDPLAAERLALDRERLRLEGRRLAFEVRLKRRELAHRQPPVWREFLANPLAIAVVGGFITLMTQILTEARRADIAREADGRQAKAARESAARTLQADLIKKFVEAPDLLTARGNLEFLVDAGLLPDYEARIRDYLRSNPGAGPLIGMRSGVIGRDDRVVVSSLPQDARDQFQGLGKIITDSSAGAGVCSGFLVAPRILVTASFCLDQATSGTFELLSSGGSTTAPSFPIDLASIVRVRSDSDSSGAVIANLAEPTSNVKYLPLLSTAPSRDSTFRMAFYAAEKNDFMIAQIDECRITGITERELFHLCDTGAGSSGAPLLAGSNGVIGVHLGTSPEGKRAIRADIIRSNPDVRARFGELPAR